MEVNYKDKNYLDLLKCGVPRSVLNNCGFELDKFVDLIEFDSDDKKRQIPSSKQVDVFDKTLRDKLSFKKNWVYCICGASDPNKARCCAAMLVDRYLTRQQKAKTLNDEDAQKYELKRNPLWHKIYSGFSDKLRDDKLYRERIGIPGLLVLDCIYADMGTGKYDKSRELLDMYSDIPRIIIGAGTDPIDLCRNGLYCVPNRVLYLADSFDVIQF